MAVRGEISKVIDLKKNYYFIEYFLLLLHSKLLSRKSKFFLHLASWIHDF